MVRNLFALVMACCTTAALAVPAYRLDRTSIALGESVTLTLTAPPGRLEQLDLAALSRVAEIHNRNIGRGMGVETLTLTLYPRKIGRIDLAIPGLPGRVPVLEVTDGSGSTPRVRLRVATDAAVVHARQPVRLTLEACHDGGSAMQWSRPPLPTREGLLVRALGEDQQDVEIDGLRCTAQRWHWALTPTAAGAATLPLPMLEAGMLGRRLRFAPPPLQLLAQPLPAWLPSEAAIGRPTLAAAPLPAQWPIDRPLAWRIEVAGAYSADALKTLIALQLAGQAELTAYPPTMEILPSETATPHHALTLYLLPRTTGTATLPELFFPWYDTTTGRLEQLRLSGAVLEIIDPARQRLLTALGILAALTTSVAAGFFLHRHLGWRLRRRRASADLLQAADIDALARQLRAFSLRAGVSPAPTLGEWRQRMERETTMRGLAPLITAIEAARYGETPGDLEQLRQQARACLRTARPR